MKNILQNKKGNIGILLFPIGAAVLIVSLLFGPFHIVKEHYEKQATLVEQAQTKIDENIQHGNEKILINAGENWCFTGSSTEKIMEYGMSKGLNVVTVEQKCGGVVFENPNTKTE